MAASSFAASACCSRGVPVIWSHLLLERLAGHVLRLSTEVPTKRTGRSGRNLFPLRDFHDRLPATRIRHDVLQLCSHRVLDPRLSAL